MKDSWETALGVKFLLQQMKKPIFNSCLNKTSRGL